MLNTQTNPLQDNTAECGLIKGLQHGNEQCYVQLVRTQHGRLLNIARRYLADDEACDVVQETFLKVFESIHDFRQDAGLKTWLQRIVINSCLNRLRKSSREREVSLSDMLAHQHRTLIWPGRVDELIERQQLQHLVRIQIRRLPETLRTVLTLRDIKGFSSAETADALKISVPAVKVRLHRARRALRQLLQPGCSASTI